MRDSGRHLWQRPESFILCVILCVRLAKLFFVFLLTWKTRQPLHEYFAWHGEEGAGRKCVPGGTGFPERSICADLVCALF